MFAGGWCLLDLCSVRALARGVFQVPSGAIAGLGSAGAKDKIRFSMQEQLNGITTVAGWVRLDAIVWCGVPSLRILIGSTPCGPLAVGLSSPLQPQVRWENPATSWPPGLDGGRVDAGGTTFARLKAQNAHAALSCGCCSPGSWPTLACWG